MKVLSVADRFDSVAEERVITISRVKDASCLHRYFKNYVERPKDEAAFVSIETAVGSFFHSCAEDWLKEIAARGGVIGDDDRMDVAGLLRKFRLSFQWQGRLREPYRIVRRGAVFDDFVTRLERIAANFNEFVSQRLAGGEVAAVEGALQISTDEMLIRGRYDLVSRDAGGRLMLWDWKSGRMPKPEYHDDFLNQKVQLGIYAIWMRYRYGTPDVEGAAVFLRDRPQCLSETFTPDIERMVLDYLADNRRRLNRLNQWPPSPGPLCDWCGWKPMCPAFKGD